MGTLRGTYALTPATTQNLSITSVTAGKSLLVFTDAAADIAADSASQAAGWIRDVHVVGSFAVCVFRLPGDHNLTGGTVALTLTLTGARALAAFALEGDYAAAPTYSTLVTATGSGTVWGTDVHTFPAAGESFAVFAYARTAMGALDITSYDSGYTEVADTGLAAGSGNEDAHLWVASKLGGSMSSNGVSVTLSTTPAAPALAGFVNYDLVPSGANAGPDQNVLAGQTVTLDGSASTAPGTITAYTWTQTAGPTVTLSGSGAGRTFTAPAGTAGQITTLRFSLTVTDTIGGTSAPDTIDVLLHPNRISWENTHAGRPRGQWHDGVGSTDMPGFARSSYYAPGQTAQFSIDYNAAFTVEVHRLGWYAGDGARQLATVTGTPTAQPAATVIPNSNGATHCANWSVNATWAIPSTAVPGWYYALLRGSGVFGHILFCVTDTTAKAPTLVTSSDATWMGAYNYYGSPGAGALTGKSVYGSGGALGDITTRSLCVSYDRPVITRAGVPQTHFFNSEYPLLRFLERAGFDVGYATKEQIDADPTVLTAGRSLVVSNGHDEYISQTVRDAFLAAQLAGVRMANFSGNDFFWRVRYGTTDDTDLSTRGRVMWCRKDTMPGPSGHVAGDPFVPGYGDWLGTWRDTRWPGRHPESELWADFFRANGIRNDSMKVPFASKTKPIWRNCAVVQALTTGQDANLGSGTLGMEWDVPATDASLQAVQVSSTTVTVTGQASDDNGQDYTLTATLVHALQLAKRPAGGSLMLVASTTQWAWGLDDFHDRGTVGVANDTVRQATLNVLADLGAPAVASLVTGAGLVQPTPVPATAYGLTAPTVITLAPAVETDSPVAVPAAKSALLVPAVEVDVAGTMPAKSPARAGRGTASPAGRTTWATWPAG